MPLIIEPYRNILSIQNLFSVTTSDVETKAHTAVLASAIGQRIAHTYKREGVIPTAAAMFHFWNFMKVDVILIGHA